MSYAGGAIAGVFPRMYFCHQCNRTVTIAPPPDGELLCPECSCGFVEEFENPNPNLNQNGFVDPLSALSSFLGSFPLSAPPSSSSSTDVIDGQRPRIFPSMIGAAGQSQTQAYPPQADIFDMLGYIQSSIADLSAGGAEIEFVINHSGSPGTRGSINIGDYFVGPGLEQLIQQLAENDPNRYGTPPASKTAVEGLPSISVDQKLLSSDLAQCAVCKDDFVHGMVVKQMPCKHVYHSDCILPWLELHSSCPVCRYELPSDDPDHVNRAQGALGLGNSIASGNNDGDGGRGGGNSQGPRVVERRFEISFPWLFGSGQDNSGNSDGGSSSDGQRNRRFN